MESNRFIYKRRNIANKSQLYGFKSPFHLSFKSVWNWLANMAAIKLFRRVQTYFRALGLHAPSIVNKNCAFNRRNLFFISVFVGPFCPVSSYLIFKANTVYEYGITFYTSIILIHLIVDFAIIMCELGNILKLIKQYEIFLMKRKLT